MGVCRVESTEGTRQAETKLMHKAGTSETMLPPFRSADKLDFVLLKSSNESYQSHNWKNCPTNVSARNFPVRWLCIVCIADLKS